MSWMLPTTPPLLIGVVVAAMVIAAETAILAVLHTTHPQVQPSAAVYILGVVAVTIIWGARLGVGVALASTLVFNIVHVPPSGLHLSLVQDGQRALIFVIVALASGGLANLARERAEEAHQRADEAEIAVEVARQILGQDDLPSGLQAGSRRLATRFGLPRMSIEVGDATVLDSLGGATVLKLDDGGGLRCGSSFPPPPRRQRWSASVTGSARHWGRSSAPPSSARSSSITYGPASRRPRRCWRSRRHSSGWPRWSPRADRPQRCSRR
ncbi:hypothetical protein GCM10027610_059200 [Dactylosporangium cerinum]